MKEKNVKYDQLIQAGRDAHAVLKLAKKADAHIERRQEKTQRAAAIWWLSKRRGLKITLHDLYALFNVTPSHLISVTQEIDRAITFANVVTLALVASKDLRDDAVEKWRPRTR